MPEIIIDLDGAATGTTGQPQSLEQVAEILERLPDDSPGGDSPVEFLVPMTLFIAIAATFCMKYYFTHRTRRDAQATVRAAIERGEALTPELLDRLVQAPAPKRSDLRRGVVLVALGIGLGAFGFLLGEPDAMRPMLAIGLVPVLLGLAYLVLWRLSGDKARN
jgi:hypothetical protein